MLTVWAALGLVAAPARAEMYRWTDDQGGMQAPPAPVVVDLSAQGEAFFNGERGSVLGQLVDGMVDRMFDSRDRRNQPAQDAQLMAQVYGTDRDLAKRRIKAEIYRLLTSTNQRDATLRAHCSGGTYMRAIAHDLGRALGCGAHLHALRRTGSGEFTRRAFSGWRRSGRAARSSPGRTGAWR